MCILNPANFQAVKAVAKILGKLFAGAAAGCLIEAANECRSHWKNPKAALDCGVSAVLKKSNIYNFIRIVH